MSGDAAPAAADHRWLRFAKIVAVFVVIAPLIGGSIAFGMMLFITGDVPVDRLPALWLNWAIHLGYVFGAPCALVVGAIFAAFAIFGGRAQLWVALAPTVLFLLPLQWVVGDPIWRFGIPFTSLALTLFMVPTAIAWYLSRPWHHQ